MVNLWYFVCAFRTIHLQLSNNYYKLADRIYANVPNLNPQKLAAIVYADDKALAFRLQAYYESYSHAKKEYKSITNGYVNDTDLKEWINLKEKMDKKFMETKALPPGLSFPSIVEFLVSP